MLFSQQNRPTVVEKNPGVKVTEISKILGEMWRALSDDEKTKYKGENKS